MHLFCGNGALLQLVTVEEGCKALGYSRQGRLSSYKRGSGYMPPKDCFLQSPHFLSPHFENGSFVCFFPFHIITMCCTLLRKISLLLQGGSQKASQMLATAAGEVSLTCTSVRACFFLGTVTERGICHFSSHMDGNWRNMLLVLK